MTAGLPPANPEDTLSAFRHLRPASQSPDSRTLRRAAATVAGAALTLAGLAVATQPAHAANGVPKYDHVVLVMEENQSYATVVGVPSSAR